MPTQNHRRFLSERPEPLSRQRQVHTCLTGVTTARPGHAERATPGGAQHPHKLHDSTCLFILQTYIHVVSMAVDSSAVGLIYPLPWCRCSYFQGGDQLCPGAPRRASPRGCKGEASSLQAR